MLYLLSYVDHDGTYIQAEFDSLEEAQKEWEWANAHNLENLTLTEYKTDEGGLLNPL